jgi:hypothetical protein
LKPPIIQDIRPATNNEWDEIWLHCPYAIYHQSREWAEIWEEYSGGTIRPEPVMLYFSDGKRAVLPFSRQRYLGGIINRYISSLPDVKWGGWISSDVLEVSHGTALSEYIKNKYANIKWNINYFDSLVDKIIIPRTRTHDHYIISLDEPFDEIYKRIHKNQRKAINKSMREGVSIRVASSLDDWKNYYFVYTEYLHKWGENAVEVKTWKLLETMYRRSSPYIKLWIVEYNHEIIGGRLCLLSSKVASGWGMYVLKKYSYVRGPSYLNYTLIKYCCENGYRWIDLGTSGNERGLIEFKERFSARRIISYKYEKYSPCVTYTRNAVNRLRQIFRI